MSGVWVSPLVRITPITSTDNYTNNKGNIYWGLDVTTTKTLPRPRLGVTCLKDNTNSLR